MSSRRPSHRHRHQSRWLIREVLGFSVGDSEDEAFWRAFLQGLRRRGLHGVRLVISDQHSGLIAALRRTMQGVAHQRCRCISRGTSSPGSQRATRRVAAASRTVFAYATRAEISEQYDKDSDMLRAQFPKAAELMDGAKERAAGLHAIPPRPLARNLVDEPWRG